MSRPVAYLCLAASMMLVGSYVGLSKELVGVFPVFLLAWLRFAIAALAMLPWLRRDPGEPILVGDDHWRLFAESLFGNVGFSTCMLFGVAATSATAAGVVMATLPPAVALLSFVFLRERITLREGLAILCAGAGIGVLASATGSEGSLGHGSLGGHALLVGAVLCEATYVVIGSRLTQALSPRRISALINAWGLVLMTPLGLWQARHFDFTTVDAGTWALLVYYALAASVVSVWLWMKGLAHVPAQRAGVFTVLLPLTAAAIGAGWLGEPLRAAHGIAFALAVVGLVLASRARRAPADAR